MNCTNVADFPGSAALSEAELAERMERCIHPNAEFHHADHLRLAWHYLRAWERGAAAKRMCETIRRFAASLGHPEKYHETVTIAWVRLVAAAIGCTPQHAEFGPFIEGHRWLLNRDALLAFYSGERLASGEARVRWVEPDLHPLPPGE